MALASGIIDLYQRGVNTDEYTKLMLHSDGDKSDSNHNITYNGGALLSGTESKFGETAAYFDGTNDYLSISDSTDFDLGISDEPFTIEMFFNRNDSTPTEQVLINRGGGTNNWNTTDGNQFLIQWQSSNIISFYYNNSGSAVGVTQSIAGIGIFVHIAIVFDGTNTVVYVNGVGGSPVSTGAYTKPSGSTIINIGRNISGQDYVDGYIDEVRISKGVARWTTDFTPPTSVYTTDEYTKLLLHMEGDSSGQKHEITTVGTPIENAVGKFSGAWEFNGSTDYLTIPNHTDLDLSSGNYTIDLWFYVTAFNDSVILQKDGVYGSDFSSYYVGVTNSTTKKLTCATGRGTSTGGTSYTGTTTLSTGIWYHAAMVVENTTVSLYLNGQLEASGTKYSPITNDSDDLTIGFIPNGPSSYHFSGKIDEIRISKGIARWTTSFTPPTAPYYTETTEVTGSINLSITGGTPLSESIGLHVQNDQFEVVFGESASGSIDIFIEGAIENSLSLNLYERGFEYSQNSIDIYSYGSIELNGSINLVTISTISINESIDIYSFGASLLNESMTIFTKGHVDIPLIITGGGERGIYGDISESIDLICWNTQGAGAELVEKEFSLYIEGTPEVEVSASIPLILSSDNGTIGVSIPLIINPKVIYKNTGLVDLYIFGTEGENTLGGLYNDINLYTLGFYGSTLVPQPSILVEFSKSVPIYIKA